MRALISIAILSLVYLAANPPAAADAAQAASPLGVWKTFDDKTGKARAIVRIYEQDGKLFGRIEQSFTPGDEHRTCAVCTDERKNQPIVVNKPMAVNRGATAGSPQSPVRLLAVPVTRHATAPEGVLVLLRSADAPEFSRAQLSLVKHLSRHISMLLETDFDVLTGLQYGIRFENDEQTEAFVYQMSEEVKRRLNSVHMQGRSLTLKVMKRDPSAPLEPPKVHCLPSRHLFPRIFN